MVIEFFHGFNQPQIAFLNQVKEQHPTTYISFGNADNQTQVGFCQFLFGSFVAFFHTLCQFHFFLCGKQRNFADFLQIHSDRVVDIDAFGQCQVKVFFNFFFCVQVAQDINALCFQIFINPIDAVGVQVQIRQMVHDLFIL